MDVSVENEGVVSLPETVTGEGLDALVEQMLANRGEPMMIDASNVQRIETHCVEALVSAGKLWKDESVKLEVQNPSAAFESALDLLGLNVSEIENEEN